MENLTKDEKLVDFLTSQFNGLLTENIRDILRGYQNAGEDTFAISASIKLSGSKEFVESDATISFTLEKVKANSKFSIDMNQMSMFLEETGEEIELAEVAGNAPQAA